MRLKSLQCFGACNQPMARRECLWLDFINACTKALNHLIISSLLTTITCLFAFFLAGLTTILPALNSEAVEQFSFHFYRLAILSLFFVSLVLKGLSTSTMGGYQQQVFMKCIFLCASVKRESFYLLRFLKKRIEFANRLGTVGDLIFSRLTKLS